MRIPAKYFYLAAILVMGFLLLGTATGFASPSLITKQHLPIVFGVQPTPTPENNFGNPGFEQGTDGWVVQSNQGDQVVTSGKAHSGSYSAALGNGDNNRVTSIAQQVKIPQDAYIVQFYQWVQSLELCPSNNRVSVYIGTQYYGQYNICQDSNNGKWVVKEIDLFPYRGQTVVFRLEFKSSTILGNYLYVDDFSFQLP